MYEVVGLKLKSSNRIYFFETNKLELKKGDLVVVETEKGLHMGEVATEIRKINDKDLASPLKKVLRTATRDDQKQSEENEKQSDIALADAKKFAKKLELNMNFIDAHYTLDRSQLICNFVADERVDFRELAKKMASIYKTRIELRQIGVRDKAKEVGGLGPCGRFLCCNSFLTDFASVSINMAKNQYIALNPTKINGICGRLLCCLNYEDEQYTEMKKEYPNVNTIIEKDGVKGKVVAHNLFKRTYTIEKPDRTIQEIEIGKK